MNGYTYTVVKPTVGSPDTETQAFHFECKLVDGVKVPAKILITSSSSKKGTLNVNPDPTNVKQTAMVIMNYCDLTINNVIIDGGELNHKGSRYTMSNNNGNSTIKNSEVIASSDSEFTGALAAFDVYVYQDYPSTNVTVENSIINGNIEIARGSNIGDTQLPSITIGSGVEVIGELKVDDSVMAILDTKPVKVAEDAKVKIVNGDKEIYFNENGDESDTPFPPSVGAGIPSQSYLNQALAMLNARRMREQYAYMMNRR